MFDEPDNRTEEEQHCRRLKAHLHRNRMPFSETRRGNSLTIEISSRPLEEERNEGFHPYERSSTID